MDFKNDSAFIALRENVIEARKKMENCQNDEEREKAEESYDWARIKLAQYVERKFEEEKEKQAKKDSGEVVETRPHREFEEV